MKKLKHIIFDCDGVLVDSEIIANRIEVEVKNELGFPITLEEQIHKFVGHSMKSPVVVEELARLPAHYWETVDERCRKAYFEELKAISGVAETLELLPHQKCVASSSATEWLHIKLSLTNLISHFPNAVFSTDAVQNSKPAPDLFLYAMERMHWSKNDCLVVEDSVAGVTAGKAAGLVVCGFIGGAHILPGHAERLLEAGADYIVSDFRSIARLVE